MSSSADIERQSVSIDVTSELHGAFTTAILRSINEYTLPSSHSGWQVKSSLGLAFWALSFVLIKSLTDFLPGIPFLQVLYPTTND